MKTWMQCVGVISVVMASAACSGSSSTDTGNDSKGLFGNPIGTANGNSGTSGAPANSGGGLFGNAPAAPSASGSSNPSTPAAGQCGVQTGAPACDSCIAQKCCEPVRRCVGNQQCAGLANCFQQCANDSACDQQCIQQYQGGTADLQAAAACLNQSCPGVCN
jgi:hypothetical protein